jgi:hypothetical protein
MKSRAAWSVQLLVSSRADFDSAPRPPVRDGGRRSRFTLQPVAGNRIFGASANSLQRHGTMEPKIGRRVDDPHPTLAQLSFNLITACDLREKVGLHVTSHRVAYTSKSTRHSSLSF